MLTQFANDADRSQMVAITERDIVFDCPHCRGELVVDQDGASMTLACSHCGHNVVVPGRSVIGALAPPPPTPSYPAAAAAPSLVAPLAPEITLPPAFDFTGQTPEQIRKRFEDLMLQLKENQSQTTEMRGHVNRATIELHRMQLKLKKLQDRQADIQGELHAAKTSLEHQPAA